MTKTTVMPVTVTLSTLERTMEIVVAMTMTMRKILTFMKTPGITTSNELTVGMTVMTILK